jgi:hypothetical protein
LCSPRKQEPNLIWSLCKPLGHWHTPFARLSSTRATKRHCTCISRTYAHGSQKPIFLSYLDAKGTISFMLIMPFFHSTKSSRRVTLNRKLFHLYIFILPIGDFTTKISSRKWENAHTMTSFKLVAYTCIPTTSRICCRGINQLFLSCFKKKCWFIPW